MFLGFTVFLGGFATRLGIVSLCVWHKFPIYPNEMRTPSRVFSHEVEKNPTVAYPLTAGTKSYTIK